MRSYLLDTNACIALIKGSPKAVRQRFGRAIRREATLLVPTVVIFELWYGAAKSQNEEATARGLENFLTGALKSAPFEDEDAREAAYLRAELERTGKPIGPYDVLIAAQARRRRVTLVTSNVSEFERVAGLNWEDWAKSG